MNCYMYARSEVLSNQDFIKENKVRPALINIHTTFRCLPGVPVAEYNLYHVTIWHKTKSGFYMTWLNMV